MILKNIQRWLASSQRDYHEGLRYFNQFASSSKKTRYGQFLNNVDKNSQVRNVVENSNKFSLLIDEITRIEGDIRRSPESFKQALAQSSAASGSTQTPSSGGTTATQDPGAAESGQSTATKDTASTQPEKTTLDALPAEFDVSKARLKEIIPVMAKLHADMANETIADDKRLEIVRELVMLDNERRAIWIQIDAYTTNGKIQIEKSPDEKLIEEQSLALGAQMQKRIDQLKENIARNEKSLKTAQEKKNKTSITNAKKRLAKYNTELATLEQAVKK